MKIAIVFHRLGPYHWARLKAAAATLNLLAVEQFAETAEYAWDKVEGDGGFERVTLFATDDPSSASKTELNRRTQAALTRAKPQVVVIPGWSNSGGLAALAWALRHGVPTMVMSESTAGDRPRTGWKEWLKRRVVALCSAGFVGGTAHRDYLQTLGLAPERIALGYDAVDNAHFEAGANAVRTRSDARSSLGLPQEYMLASNRFLPQKNLLFLLDAYAAYRRLAGPGAWSMVLLGDGPLKPEIMARRTALGLEETVLLPGFKQYPELPTYYGLASAFIHPATSEPWGLVVNEALAAGLPVIVSERCGCAPDLVVEGRNGWTFDPVDSRALTERMLHLTRLSASDRVTMAQAGKEVVARWSVDRFAAGLRESVEMALAAKFPRATWLDQGLLRLLVDG